MSKAIRYAAVTVAACLASGALAFAAHDSADWAGFWTLSTATVFGMLAFFAASEDQS